MGLKIYVHRRKNINFLGGARSSMSRYFRGGSFSTMYLYILYKTKDMWRVGIF